jgi:N-methylhydantoinase A
MRYHGQNFEQDVPLRDGPVDGDAIAELAEAFHLRHEALYGYALREHPLELVHFALTATGPERAVEPAAAAAARYTGPTEREVVFRGHGRVATRIVARHDLTPGDVVAGPAIIVETTSTTLVLPGQAATVVRADALIVEAAR